METALIVALVLMAAAILALIAALLRSKQSGPVPTDDRLDSMNRELGEVKEGTRRMVEVGEEMRRTLGSPTLRGALGERMLERLLGEVLPASAYSTQHDLSNGNRVDAIVRLRDGQAVSVDSKFPLENYERLVEASDKGRQDAERRKLHRDVKRHVDDIAGKYICPGETLDFAFMYIPAENVYHEIVGGGGLDDVLDYAWGRRVILTSPNTLYAYLVIVLQGLLGLEVERSSRDMLAKLTRLELDIEEFAADYDVLGKHLRNAQSKYDDGLPKLKLVQRDWPARRRGAGSGRE